MIKKRKKVAIVSVKKAPKRSIKISHDDLVSSTQLALNQVNHGERIHTLAVCLNQMSQSIDSIVTQVNKAQVDLARRIESIEHRLEEVDKLLCKDRISADVETPETFN